jgi:heterodisulfide reductase subunit B
MKYGYFPGCSLERNAAAYDISSRALAGPLGMELVEVEDWNCCGATEYVCLNMTASFALIARNLAQAAKNTDTTQLVAPCSACYLNLRKCDNYMAQNPALAEKVNTALAAGGLAYKGGTLKVRHLLDVMVNDIGCEAIAAKVTRPLKGLRVVPYYGCMIVRPEYHGEAAFDGVEQPTTLDQLLAALGAEVVPFTLKAACCGGHMTQISEATAFEMIRRLVKCATDGHADIVAVLCPMCQLNLDAFQGPMNNFFKTDYKMPVLYFTQLVGLAFGMDARPLGIGSELVDARRALGKIGVDVPPAETAEKSRKPKRGDKSLPMPRMKGK